MSELFTVAMVIVVADATQGTARRKAANAALVSERILCFLCLVVIYVSLGAPRRTPLLRGTRAQNKPALQKLSLT
ncbi:MAG TPA: hypothetical protein PLY97_09860 [Acidocella sp.]|nr:hypothetical protein [Acidocella sp.]